ncbi:hypothetical protein TNCV_4198131 [Trichonephila clavipes]|nr:hypothetical protein TNCV_4198131 [Trichonephila clavipes]
MTGHIVRMDEDRTTLKSLQHPINWLTEKRQAKSKMDLKKDLLVLRTKKWRTLADFITNDDPNIEQKGCAAFHSGRESISGGSPISFTEDTAMPYSGFEPELTR